MKNKLFFSYRSFWPEFEAMKDFKKANINTICIFPANTNNSLGTPYCDYPPVWRGIDKYDFDSFDKQFDDALKVNPNAEFICMVDLNTPSWLQRQLSLRGHSAECESFTVLSGACSNPEWRKATEGYLEAIVKRMEERYGDRVKAYLLAAGTTDEWMDYTRGVAGRNKTAAWKEWLSRHDKEQMPVPALERIDHAEFENLIRNPKNERDIIDYAQFSGDVIVETVLRFTSKTRSLIPKERQVGMFFGYILELIQNRLVSAGHLEYERLYSSPNIDFFISPGTYQDRPMGGGSGFMVPYGTLKRFGKSFLHEMDHRTPTYNCDLDDYVSIGWLHPWKDQKETNAGLKREFSLATVNQASLWCFDMWGGVFKTEETMKVVAKSKEIWDKYSKELVEEVAETALVVDPQSTRLINDANPDVSKIYAETRNKLNRLGAPFEVISFNDLSEIDLSRFKLMVFPGTFLVTRERRDILEKYVFNSNRTVLFAYAPGICDGDDLDTNRIKELCGAKFGTKGLSTTNMNSWKSAYVPDYDTLTPAVLKQLAVDAGVNMYCEWEVPVYANSRLVAIHTAQSGDIDIKLPQKYSRVKELYSDKIVAENTDCFTFAFETPDTRLFALEK